MYVFLDGDGVSSFRLTLQKMPYRKFDFFQDILVLASTVRRPSYQG